MAEKQQSDISRKERKKLKKQQKQKSNRREKRKKAILRWSQISIGAILLLAAVYFVFLHKPDTSNRGILRIAKSEYNLGVASIRRGVISVEIPLINTGDGDLTITALDSSCGCTTARIVNHGVKSPIFGMAGHGKNPKDWSTVIKPGEQAVLNVYYDPAVHPDLRGPVTRIMTIYSDDPVSPRQEIRIKVNQIG